MKPFRKNFVGFTIIASLMAAANFVYAGPYVFWANNDHDRGHTVDGSDFEQDDLSPLEILKLPAYQQVPDCNYRNASSQRVIPCTRDLEDFARLWMSGVDSNLVAALPNNSTLTLSWAEVEGEPTIDLFAAADPGIGYLTNATIAAKQIDPAQCPYIGRLGPGQQIQFTKSTWQSNQFIWCGVKYGGGGLTLTIADGNSNTLVQTKAYIAIVDIKQMYERWTVGENPNVLAANVARLGVEGLPSGATPFQYDQPSDTNTPYILFVHGWNMETWEKDRFAEAAFKRLYWQGYQGRFGVFRWPTGNKFGSIISVVTDARNYDNSESNAWHSARGLLNKLTELNTQYPGNVYLMAHSMGNVVAGEALRLATNAVVNTYIALQGAVPAHAYDPTTTFRNLGVLDSGTPDRYSSYFTNGAAHYFHNAGGAVRRANYYNAHDYALGDLLWQLNQDLKPNNGLPYPGYHYSSSSGFYKVTGAGTNNVHYLSFPNNTYELFAYCVEARCYAIGAQANVSDFLQQNAQDLWPPDPSTNDPNLIYSAHKWHSAQFRSDNVGRHRFWNQVLETFQLTPPQ